MRHKILFYEAGRAVLTAALICVVALAVDARSNEKRSSNGYAVDIENFGKVNEHLYRGAEPKGRHYEQLAALGIKTVLDLRDDADRGARAEAERAGLRYLNLPMQPKSYPKAETAARFLEIVNDPANGTVFVHCAGGRHRTGVLIAVYRMEVDHWTIDQAYNEMKQYDFYTSWGHGCYKDYVYDYAQKRQVAWKARTTDTPPTVKAARQ